MEFQGRNVHWRQKAQNTGHMSSCLQLQRQIGTFRSIGPGELCTHPRSLTSESETDQQTATLQYSQVSSILTSPVSCGGGGGLPNHPSQVLTSTGCHCSGRYVSYWKAYLLSLCNYSKVFVTIQKMYSRK